MSESPTRTRAWAIAVVCTLAMTVSYVDRQVLSALGPTVREKLDIDATHFGWLTSAFALSYLTFAPLAGALVDRFGPRRGLTAAVLVWSAVSALQGAVVSFRTLLAARALLGAAEAPSFPAAARAVRSVLPPKDRSAGLGLLFTGSSLGTMIAGPLAIALNTKLNWRLAFGIAAAIGTLWVPLFLWMTRDRATRRALAHDDGVLPREDDAATPARGPTLAERMAVAAKPDVLRAVVLVIASAPAILLVIGWFPQILLAAFHVRQADQAAYVWAPPLAFDLGAVGVGYLASLRDRKAPGGVSAKADWVALAAALSATLALVPRVADARVATGVVGLSMAGGGALYTLAAAEMLSRVDKRWTAAAGGVTAAAQSIVHIVASPLIGRSVDATKSFSHSLVALGLWTLPWSLVWIAWPRFIGRRALVSR